ncbi:hypothetical protein ACMTN4_00875 (plasmid) [Rhodococcus globerulus]|uniref:hypothetical protein n=1 Tax=Rhodococcus globerulus TaxID=33008 RepID=UPI0039EBE78D
MLHAAKRQFYAVPAKAYGWSSIILIASMFALWSIALMRSPTTAKDWASPLIAIAAVVVAVFAMMQSRRSADAAHRNLTISELQENRRRHGWTIEPHPQADRYILRNTGTITATDVQLEGDFFHLRFVTDTDTVEIAPGEARSFDAASSIDQYGVEIAVTWRSENEKQRRTWTEVLQPSPASEASWKNFQKENAATRADERQRANAQREESLRLLLQLGDAYSTYKHEPADPASKLKVQLLASLPPHLAREIGYQVDVARDVWGENEYPFEGHLAEEDHHIINGITPEIELMWNVRTVSGYSVYGPIDAQGPNSEPRVSWAIRGYVDRAKERESGNRQLRLSARDEAHREQTRRWAAQANKQFAAARAELGIPDPDHNDDVTKSNSE